MDDPARSPSHLTLVGGASNSRPSATTCTPGGAGFDTIRLRYRQQEGAYDRARGLDHAVMARGEVRRTVEGVTLGAYPDGLVTVEGRLAAILHGQDDHRLLDAAALCGAPDAAADLFGLDARQPVGVGRADLASELRFADGREGIELLRAASYVDVPWLKVATEGGKRDALETVAWRSMNGRSIVLRLYDKGRETGTAAPGEWLRLERQRRYRKSRERTVAELVGEGLHGAFVGRELVRLVAGVEDVHVCDRAGAVDRLRLAFVAGQITAEMHERLVGYVVSGSPGLKRRTAYGRAAELRRLGIALNPNEGGRSVVAVGDHLRAFASRWAA